MVVHDDRADPRHDGDPKAPGGPERFFPARSRTFSFRRRPTSRRGSITPRGSAPYPVLVCLHKGGFVGGDAEAYDGCRRRLASLADIAIISVNYRLAPEHKYSRRLTGDSAEYGQPFRNVRSVVTFSCLRRLMPCARQNGWSLPSSSSRRLRRVVSARWRAVASSKYALAGRLPDVHAPSQDQVGIRTVSVAGRVSCRIGYRAPNRDAFRLVLKCPV